MTPQKATLDSMRTLSLFVSYRRLSAQFQFPLSAVTLEYLSQWRKLSQQENLRSSSHPKYCPGELEVFAEQPLLTSSVFLRIFF
jgi:hypothetical protein